MANDGSDADLDDLTLAGALKGVCADLGDLVRKEIRLAKAEMRQAAAGALKAGLWMGAAGLLASIAGLLVIQAVVFGIASLGLGLGWASLAVAAGLGAAAFGAFLCGRSLAGSVKPKRILRQLDQDIQTMREQLT